MSGKQGYAVQQGNGRRATNAVKKGRNGGAKKAKSKKEDDFNWRCDDADEEPSPSVHHPELVLPGGYKSVKSRWLSEFEKDQKRREAEEQAAAEEKRKAEEERLLREAELRSQEEAARRAEQAAILAAEQERLRQEEEERARLEAEAAAARREEALAKERELKEQRQREKDERMNREARARLEQIRLEKEAAALRIKEAEIRAAAAAAEAAAAALKEQEQAREREREEEEDDDEDVDMLNGREEAVLEANAEAAREEAEAEIREAAETHAKLEIASSVMREAELDTEMPLMEETSLLRGDDEAAAEKPAEREPAPKADRSSAEPKAGGVGHRRKHSELGDHDADERPAKQVKREVPPSSGPLSQAKKADKPARGPSPKPEPLQPPKAPTVKAEEGRDKEGDSNRGPLAKLHAVKAAQNNLHTAGVKASKVAKTEAEQGNVNATAVKTSKALKTEPEQRGVNTAHVKAGKAPKSEPDQGDVNASRVKASKPPKAEPERRDVTPGLASKGLLKTEVPAVMGKVKEEDVKAGRGLRPEPQVVVKQEGAAEPRAAAAAPGEQVPPEKKKEVGVFAANIAGDREQLAELELARYSSFSELVKAIRATSSGGLPDGSLMLEYQDHLGDIINLRPDCKWSTFVAEAVAVIIRT